MKTFRNIFLWFGVLVMTGHSIAPHCHDGHGDEKSICQVERFEFVSILHLLGSFFHADPGGNHLEEFQLPGFDYFLVGKPDVTAISPSPQSDISFVAEPLPYGKCIAPSHLRGPPVKI